MEGEVRIERHLPRLFGDIEMATNYAEIAFTAGVKKEQEKYNSRRQYERMEKISRGSEMSFVEADFIERRDSFYLATTSENGYPYVQFRGGASGFLKVLDSKTLGYADFRGNLQYVSVGNLRSNKKAALILMDYPNRQRLKIYATIEVFDAEDAPELLDRLAMPDYKAKIERAMILHIDAFDWNCPQHITPRYTMSEIGRILIPFKEQIALLEKEIDRLKCE